MRLCNRTVASAGPLATYEPRKLHVRDRGGRNPLSHYTGTYERQKSAVASLRASKARSALSQRTIVRLSNARRVLTICESPRDDSKRAAGNAIRVSRVYELLSVVCLGCNVRTIVCSIRRC